MADQQLEVIEWETDAAGVIVCSGPFAGRLVRLKDHWAEILMGVGYCQVVRDHPDGRTAREMLEKMLRRSSEVTPQLMPLSEQTSPARRPAVGEEHL